MPLIVLRHARAGKSQKWVGDDRLRPLDERGRHQAEALVGTLAPHPVERILSSAHLRCVQTVEPLAAARGLPIEERRELAEGSTLPETLALIDELSRAPAVLCTHGDVIHELLGHELDKGAAWIVRRDQSGLEPLKYLPPPA
jgi:phosphohistidine phosphatase SixA